MRAAPLGLTILCLGCVVAPNPRPGSDAARAARRVERPRGLEFGSVLVGQGVALLVSVKSGGRAALTVSDIYLKEGASAGFALDLTLFKPLPLKLPAHDPEAPRVSSREALVRFAPREERDYSATLVIITDDPTKRDGGVEGALEVPIRGQGALRVCPISCVLEAEIDATPLKIITLDGGCSITPEGAPLIYHWSVIEQPEGATARLAESFFDPDSPADGGPPDDAWTPQVQLAANRIGEYAIELKVAQLSEPCAGFGAVVYVHVGPDAELHVQLTWDTPEDPDQADSWGVDLDLHLLHPGGTTWTTAPLDCFSQNPNPDWGATGPINDCTLDFDDMSGAGPEDLRVRAPEDTREWPQPYRVGVHYYGSSPWFNVDNPESAATVRVYFNGAFEAEWRRVLTGVGDFWEVAGIIWTPEAQRVQEIDRLTPGD